MIDKKKNTIKCKIERSCKLYSWKTWKGFFVGDIDSESMDERDRYKMAKLIDRILDTH